MVRSPIAIGVLLALGSAIAFGLTTPVIAWAGRDAGPLTTAALLYVGAISAALAMRIGPRSGGSALGRRDVPRILGIAVAGAPNTTVTICERPGA